MTRDELARTTAALKLRPAEELAGFVASLLTEESTGVGAYARAFAADDSRAAAEIIAQTISSWKHYLRHDSYHQAAAAAQRLEWALDAIERCVKPRDPAAAFDLVVLFFKADDAVGPDDLEHVAGAFERAAALFWELAADLPADQVRSAAEGLLAADCSGYREFLRGAGPKTT